LEYVFFKEMANEKEERAARDYFWGMESIERGESGVGRIEWRRRVEKG
jgi:hypothetical protein